MKKLISLTITISLVATLYMTTFASIWNFAKGNEDQMYTAKDVQLVYNEFPQIIRDCSDVRDIYIMSEYGRWGKRAWGSYSTDRILRIFPSRHYLENGRNWSKGYYLKIILLHEIGHSFMWKSEYNKNIWKLIYKGGERKLCKKNYREDFAECFRMYFSNKDTLRRNFPLRYETMNMLIKMEVDL